MGPVSADGGCGGWVECSPLILRFYQCTPIKQIRSLPSVVLSDTATAASTWCRHRHVARGVCICARGAYRRRGLDQLPASRRSRSSEDSRLPGYTRWSGQLGQFSAEGEKTHIYRGNVAVSDNLRPVPTGILTLRIKASISRSVIVRPHRSARSSHVRTDAAKTHHRRWSYRLPRCVQP